jgi:hypothetical protein
LATAAWAVVVDNLVPNPNYLYQCHDGGGTIDSSTNTVCQTDNSTVTYAYDVDDPYKLEAVDRQVVTQMIGDEYQQTHLRFVHDTSPTFSGSAETDIFYQEGTVPGSDEGIAYCNDDSPSPIYECDQHYVRIEPGNYDLGLSCHETGHTVGLLHGAQSYPTTGNNDSVLGCMQKAPGDNARLGANQRENINDEYPAP